MKTVIAGQGKTGTTALFFKIQQALPADTWCVFEPRVYEARPGHTGHVLAKVLIGVGRSVDVDSFHRFDKKIILTRDPRDTLVSRVLYDIYNEPTICADDGKVAAFVDLLRRKEADPAGTPLVDLIDLFDGMSRRAMRPRATGDAGVALAFQQSHPDYAPARYEDIVRADFTGVETYLGFSVGPGVASVPVEYARVARTKSAGNWRSWLTPRDVDVFRPFFTPYLEYNGYGDDWTLSAEPRIDPEHSSAYVLRLVDERRRLTPAS